MFIGMLLAVLSGVFLGVCFLPMRYMTRFAWENTWFVWVISGCLVFSRFIAWLTVPPLTAAEFQAEYVGEGVLFVGALGLYGRLITHLQVGRFQPLLTFIL
jgi:hypothetical protein